MKFYIVEDGFIAASGEDDSTAPDMPRAAEAAELLRHYPTPPEGYSYRLREDMTWALIALPDEESEGEEHTNEKEDHIDG